MVGDNEDYQILSLPVKLPFWCDSAKFASNYTTSHFHGNLLLFSDAA